jgi:lysophospholipase L1-like esterase
MTAEAIPPRHDLAWVPGAGRRGYLRFVALGDSATFGFGDADRFGVWRGWARLLVGAIAQDHAVSFCNLAVTGATIADVRRDQLGAAVDHRAQVASLVVGLNDTMRAAWSPVELREDLLHCAQRLSEQGALLLTVRFHDHARVLHLPGPLGRRLRARIDVLNGIYDEIHEQYGGLRVDLAAHPGVYDRQFWSIDRLHPSELGHRALAHEFTTLLNDAGLAFEPPGIDLDGTAAGIRHNLRWLAGAGLPWLGRRTRDLAPAVARTWIRAGRERRTAQPTQPVEGGWRLRPWSGSRPTRSRIAARLRPVRP